jgi:hypothetical protein
LSVNIIPRIIQKMGMTEISTDRTTGNKS